MRTERVTIFDLDKTLSHLNVSVAFGRFLYKRGAISFLCMLALISAYGLNKIGFLSIESLHSISFRLFFYGKESAKIQSEALLFLKENEKHLFRPGMLFLLKEAKSRGDEVWIQSSSPDFLVQPIAKNLGIVYAIGTSYCTGLDRKFCSISKVINGIAKRECLLQFLQSTGYVQQNVTAYSDSIYDLPLLESVGTPVAVCPDKRLKKIAIKRKWLIWEE